MAQQITLQQLYSAKNSVATRRDRLRKTKGSRRNHWQAGKSPIAEIEAFDRDIDDMDRILKGMEERLHNAKITIEI